MEALPLYDRVAFAAVHLPDHTLQERLLTMEKQCCDAGCLYGLLLTGLNREMNCQMLLQKYYSITYSNTVCEIWKLNNSNVYYLDMSIAPTMFKVPRYS